MAGSTVLVVDDEPRIVEFRSHIAISKHLCRCRAHWIEFLLPVALLLIAG